MILTYHKYVIAACPCSLGYRSSPCHSARKSLYPSGFYPLIHYFWRLPSVIAISEPYLRVLLWMRWTDRLLCFALRHFPMMPTFASVGGLGSF